MHTPQTIEPRRPARPSRPAGSTRAVFPRDRARGAAAVCHVSVALAVIGAALLAPRVIRADEKAPRRTPDRQELWVPSKDLKRVLEKHPDAVMLTKEQYDALLRDAGRVKPGDEKAPPPQGAVVETMRLHGKVLPGASSVLLEGVVSVRALAEGWSAADVMIPFREMSHLSSGAGVLAAEIAKSDKAKQSDGAPSPSRTLTMLVRGPRRHEVAFSALLRAGRTAAGNQRRLVLTKTLVPTMLELDLPPGATVVSGPPYEQKGTLVRVALGVGGSGVIEWREPLPGASATPVFSQDFAGEGLVSEAELTVRGKMRVTSSATDSPFQDLAFDVLPPSATVVAVRGASVVAWEQSKDGLTVRLREPAAATELEIETRALLSLPEKDSAWADAPALRLRGAQHAGMALVLGTYEGVELLQTRGGTRDSAHSLQWDAASGNAGVLLRRATPHVVVDADAEIRVERDTVRIARTVNITTDRPLGELRVTLPQGETLLDVAEQPAEQQAAASAKPAPMEWKQTGPLIELKWPGGLGITRPSRVFIVSQLRLQAAADAAAPPQSVTVRNIAVPDADKLAGYIALDHDAAWRATVTQARGLEDRDARLTPVHGKAAWFSLREHELVFELRRRDSVLDAEITAFALPRAKTIEIEGQIVLQITGAPARTLTVGLAPAAARLMRFVSPLVGEQQLDGAKGEWKITFAREIAGRQVLRFRLSLPADGSAAADAPAEGATAFTATLPRFEIAAARRFHGSWVVEANTDTQLTFQTQGLQPVDVMRVPSVEGYEPRHRLVAAYAYGPGAHTLALSATRHAASELAALVITRLDLTSVLDPDGSSRHEAVINLRHTGEQFAQVRLPQGAQLLSLLVEHAAVKPVRGEGGSIAIPLPGDSANRENVRATVLFDLPGAPWGASGRRALAPVEILGGAPVLVTDWRLYAPDGFSYAKVKTGLEQEGLAEPESLLSVLNPFGGPGRPPGAAVPADANSEFERVIRGDEYYAAARRGMSAEDVRRSEYYEAARDHTRARMVNDVNETWEAKPGTPSIAEREIARRSAPLEDARIAVEKGDKLYAENKTPEALAEYTSALDSLPEAPSTKGWRDLITAKIADTLAKRDREQTAARRLKNKLDSIILPSVNFSGATLEEAVEYLRLKARDLDASEGDASRRGVNFEVLKGDMPSVGNITLDLKEVPLSEALRYFTELAGMKFKVEPDGVKIVPISDLGTEMYTEIYKVPPDFLAKINQLPGVGAVPDSGLIKRQSGQNVLDAAGIPFPEGSSVNFNSATNQLIVRNTRPNLDAVQTIVEQMMPAPEAPSAKAGLLPLELELPKAGVMMRFHGAQAPEALDLRYVSWERQMAVASACMGLGAVLFALWGRRRPCLRSLLVVLLLGVAARLFAESWLPRANAMLAGWLAALVLTLVWGLLGWIVRKTGGGNVDLRKEVAA